MDGVPQRLWRCVVPPGFSVMRLYQEKDAEKIRGDRARLTENPGNCVQCSAHTGAATASIVRTPRDVAEIMIRLIRVVSKGDGTGECGRPVFGTYRALTREGFHGAGRLWPVTVLRVSEKISLTALLQKKQGNFFCRSEGLVRFLVTEYWKYLAQYPKQDEGCDRNRECTPESFLERVDVVRDYWQDIMHVSGECERKGLTAYDDVPPHHENAKKDKDYPNHGPLY